MLYKTILPSDKTLVFSFSIQGKARSIKTCHIIALHKGFEDTEAFGDNLTLSFRYIFRLEVHHKHDGYYALKVSLFILISL